MQYEEQEAEKSWERYEGDWEDKQTEQPNTLVINAKVQIGKVSRLVRFYMYSKNSEQDLQ